MEQITLKKLRRAVAPYVSGGMSSSDPRVISRLNECEERLLDKGRWKNTVGTITMCVVNGYVTLPRNVEKVLKSRINGRFSHIWSQWYEFLSNGPGMLDDNSFKHMDLIDRGFAPTQYDIPTGDNRYLMCLSEDEGDDGAKICIRGFDEYDKEVITNGQPGEILVLNKNSPVYSINKFRKITSVHKDETQGYTYLCTWDPATCVRYHLSSYHPDEEVPSYRRFAIGELTCKAENRPSTQEELAHRLDAVVKFQHVDMKHDTDIPVIQSIGAFKCMSLGINFENDSEVEKSMQLEAKAAAILDSQLANTQTEEPELDFEMNEGVAIGTINPV